MTDYSPGVNWAVSAIDVAQWAVERFQASSTMTREGWDRLDPLQFGVAAPWDPVEISQSDFLSGRQPWRSSSLLSAIKLGFESTLMVQSSYLLAGLLPSLQIRMVLLAVHAF